MKPSPAVVVVTHKGGPLLDRCLEALEKQDLAPRAVVVVVNSDADVALPPGIHLQRVARANGYASAANLGIRTVQDGPVVLLNDDTRPAPGFLAQLHAAWLAHGPAVYQPRILLADGTGRVENTGHALFPDGFNLARGRGRPAPAVGTQDLVTGTAGAFSGAAVMFAPEVMATVGLFDEDLDSFGEDVDLSLRVLRLGFPIHHVPTAEVTHVLGATWGRTNPRKVYLVERNRMRAAVRSLPLTAIATMPAWMALRTALLAMAAAGGRGPGAGVGPKGVFAALAGGAAGMAALPDALRKRQTDRQAWTVGEWAMWRHLLHHRVTLTDLQGARMSPPVPSTAATSPLPQL